MAFPASTQILANGLSEAFNTASRLKRVCQSYSAKLSANVYSETIVNIRDDMKHADSVFERIASLPGIADYAKDQVADQTLDIAAEFNAMRSAVQSVISNIESTFPSHTDGGTDYVLGWTWNPNGSGLSMRQFTPAMTATLKGLIDAVDATID